METGAAPDHVALAASHRPLAQELAELQTNLAGRPVQLRTILEALRGRAFELLMIVLALPFAVPAAVPGMSTPFGLAIAVVAVQLAASRLPWLPRRVLEARIPAGFLATVLAATKGVVAFLGKFLRTRGRALTGSHTMIAVHLIAIAAAALLLAIPLPFPFTNTFPSWAILLIAMGLLERDGLFIAAGHLVLIGSIAYFVFLGESARQSVEWALRWLGW